MAEKPEYRVTLIDLDVPFGRLVMFFVKAALAAIPATVIVWLILAFIAFVARALFGLAWFGAMRI